MRLHVAPLYVVRSHAQLSLHAAPSRNNFPPPSRSFSIGICLSHKSIRNTRQQKGELKGARLS